MAMNYVAGIDLSSFGIDIVKISVDADHQAIGVQTYTHSLGKKGDAFDRARRVRAMMPATFSPIWQDVVAIGIEEPWGKGSISTAAGYRVQGAILACLPTDVLVQPWAPATWKKAIGIGGNADKDKIRAWVVNQIAVADGWTQDLCDAYSIAVATKEALS